MTRDHLSAVNLGENAGKRKSPASAEAAAESLCCFGHHLDPCFAAGIVSQKKRESEVGDATDSISGSNRNACYPHLETETTVKRSPTAREQRHPDLVLHGFCSQCSGNETRLHECVCLCVCGRCLPARMQVRRQMNPSEKSRRKIPTEEQNIDLVLHQTRKHNHFPLSFQERIAWQTTHHPHHETSPERAGHHQSNDCMGRESVTEKDDAWDDGVRRESWRRRETTGKTNGDIMSVGEAIPSLASRGTTTTIRRRRRVHA